MSRVLSYASAVVLGVVATMAWGAAAYAGEPAWSSDYGIALRAAREARRPLLVVLDDPADVEAQVDQISLAALETGELLDHYELCRVDVSTAYGREVARRFRAATFPTTAIIDRTGSVVIFSKAGQFSDREWRDTLAGYQHGLRRPAPVARRSPPVARRSPALCFTGG